MPFPVSFLSTLILAACGNSNPDDRGGSAASGDSRADAFPITIDHRHGRTEIAAPPERVVTVGLTDHDAFLALGVVPVGVRIGTGTIPRRPGPGPVTSLEGLDRRSWETPPSLVATVEERVAEMRRDHPEFVGASVALAAPFEGIYVYSPEVANGRLITSLGFEIPSEIAELVGDSDGANLRIERVDLLDVDVMIWIDGVAGEGPLGESVYKETFSARGGKRGIAVEHR